MKSTTLAEVGAKIGDYLAEGEQGPLLVTREGKPVAVLLAIGDEDEIERLTIA